jgi:hypothetical protein
MGVETDIYHDGFSQSAKYQRYLPFVRDNWENKSRYPSFETYFLLTRLCSRDIFYLYVQLHVYAVGDIFSHCLHYYFFLLTFTFTLGFMFIKPRYLSSGTDNRALIINQSKLIKSHILHLFYVSIELSLQINSEISWCGLECMSGVNSLVAFKGCLEWVVCLRSTPRYQGSFITYFPTTYLCSQTHLFLVVPTSGH